MPYRFLVFLCFLILFNTLRLEAQPTTEDFDPFFADQLQDKLNEIGTAGDYRGLSAAVLVPGQGIWTGTYGLAAANTPLETNMRLGIASNTKAITAALILKLQDAGLLHLDDPIADYLPPYPQVDGNITIRQLLTHTSGLFDFINDWSAATQDAYNSDPDVIWTLQELVNTLGDPVFAAGSQHAYSNSNYLVAGLVAEAAGGADLHLLLHQYIFQPLALAMAYPPTDDPFAQAYANLWSSSGNSTSLDENGSRTFLTFPASAGAVWATPYDMVRWYNALFGTAFLSANSQAELRNNDGYIAYGMGIRMRNELGRSLYYHAGAWGFRSYMVHDPATGISLCLISNQYSTSVVSPAIDLLSTVLDQRPAESYDLAIVDVIPNTTNCQTTTPLAILKNEGTETIYNLQLIFGIDDNSMDTLAINIENGLAAGAQSFIPLNYPLTAFVDGQKHQLHLFVSLDTEEAQTANNQRSVSFILPHNEGLSLPYLEDFEEDLTIPSTFISLQNKNVLDWRITKFTASSGDQSLARINYYDANIEARYAFDLPLINLGSTGAQLQFDYAHANYPGVGREDLRAYISTDCGLSFIPLFELPGNELATTIPSTSIFLPEPSDWQTYSIDLSAYANSSVSIRFELENQFGNMTYLDHLRVDVATTTTTTIVANDTYRIGPNPARAFTRLHWSSSAQPVMVKLFNSLGQVVQVYYPEQHDQVLIVQRQNNPAGTYWLSIHQQNDQQYLLPVIFY
jgi:D-alanyl-D-alanine carboxypeptidase